MRSVTNFAFIALTLLSSIAQAQDPVVVDGDVEITREEFKAAIAQLPKGLLEKATADDGERFELINQFVIARKKAMVADSIASTDDDYWTLQLQLLNAKSTFVTEREVGDYQLPDLRELAKERYVVEKDRYAFVPETRLSSHILWRSAPGHDRTALREKAAEVVTEIEAGADFEALVNEYTEDPGSKSRGGLIDRWMRFGEPQIDPGYTEGVFAIEAVGGVTVAESRFGVHIIRLEGIEPEHYSPYEEVEGRIIGDLVGEYKTLATLEVARRYGMSEDGFIDDAALDTLFEEVLKEVEAQQ